MNLKDQLRENAEISAEIIKKYLKDEIKGSDKIKIASLAITQCVKFEATKGNNDALKFAISRAVSSDTKELKNNIQNNLPEYVNVKSLEHIK
jgi:hypothetical protein